MAAMAVAVLVLTQATSLTVRKLERLTSDISSCFFFQGLWANLKSGKSNFFFND
jgi:hypothetical protein